MLLTYPGKIIKINCTKMGLREGEFIEIYYLAIPYYLCNRNKKVNGQYYQRDPRKRDIFSR